jgi:uncharacterized membrane protein
MTSIPKPKRIIFLDLLRAFAVLMMIQGHTVHTLLASGYRSDDYFLFTIWSFFRGFTAPIFMFTAGTVFAYLFLSNGKSWRDNPRVKKGLQRFITLVLIGYILRFPTARIFDFRWVTDKSWLIFFSVDALHLIGFGILTLVLLFWIAEKISLKPHYLFLFVTFVLFFIYPWTKLVNWSDIFPLPIASYFTQDYGSLFPLLPWLGYVTAGGVFGSYLSSHKKIHEDKKFAINLFLVGAILYLFALLTNWVGYYFLSVNGIFTSAWEFIFQRLGGVIIVCSLMVWISGFFDDLPAFIKIVGRHSLLIYAVHIVILYGSAWVPGMWQFYRESFSVPATIISVIIMYISMTGLVLFIEWIKKVRKNKLALKNS